ncbi:MAG: iron export ABC transporter permease subunit FetB [Deltaproteobacteria bacterium]|nr:iron export ABC transporter permease subunit FetB [Deltaproteobacteria bacterium]
MRDINTLSLGLTFLLIILFILFSAWQRLGIAKDTFFSSLRGAIQLLAVGYVISWVFTVENGWILAGIVALMASIATAVSAGRSKRVKGLWKLIAAAIFVSVAVTLSLLVAFGAIEWGGKFVIPIGGMLVGQAMNNCSLFLERLISDVRVHRLPIESNLALGASPREAIRGLTRQALIADSIPTIDSMKTLGLIYLPGMMAGLIIGGISPIIAVKYQLIVIFMIVFEFGLSSMILAFLAHLFLFNRNDQLKEC